MTTDWVRHSTSSSFLLKLTDVDTLIEKMGLGHVESLRIVL